MAHPIRRRPHPDRNRRRPHPDRKRLHRRSHPATPREEPVVTVTYDARGRARLYGGRSRVPVPGWRAVLLADGRPAWVPPWANSGGWQWRSRVRLFVAGVPLRFEIHAHHLDGVARHDAPVNIAPIDAREHGRLHAATMPRDSRGRFERRSHAQGF